MKIGLLWAGLVAMTGAAAGQTRCQFYLATQSDATHGFGLLLEAQTDAKGHCALGAVNLALEVADGSATRRVAVKSAAWQNGGVHTAKAVLTAVGPQQLLLDGQAVSTSAGGFQPAQAMLYGSQQGNAQGVADYLITQISISISNGSSALSLPPESNGSFPLPLLLMSGVPKDATGSILAPAWPGVFTEDPNQPTTITVVFRFDGLLTNLQAHQQFDPLVDTYGQAKWGDWPEKVKADADLQKAYTDEQDWLAQNPPPAGFDIYGGSTTAGWTDRTSNYYHLSFRNQRWWLVSPLGNPLFYIGLDQLEPGTTPVTGREAMFQLPPQAQFSAAYSQCGANTTCLSHGTANQLRRWNFQSGWKQQQNALVSQRLASWGFAGSGKWTHPRDAGQPAVAVNPVLNHDDVPDAGQPRHVAGHPDVWDPAILSALKTSLATQIGANATNPYIIGWSVGNEVEEIVQGPEVQSILGLGASVPAKKALVDWALHNLYSDSVTRLAMAWQISAASVNDVYSSAKASPPAADVESLRRYYEGSYYSTLYQTVRSIDSNHLYVGSWNQPRISSVDWQIAADSCDASPSRPANCAIGIDWYSPSFLDPPQVDALLRAVNKPVLIGEFSYPSAYGGLRGLAWQKYAGETTLTDSDSGGLYTSWIQNAITNPNIVGMEWFEYADEAISGNGNTKGATADPTSLVIGENYGFGMVDVTDRPKSALVAKVRAANLAALEKLGLMNSGGAAQAPRH